MDASSGFGKKYGTASTLDEVLAAASEHFLGSKSAMYVPRTLAYGRSDKVSRS
jgi:hypothetical protein